MICDHIDFLERYSAIIPCSMIKEYIHLHSKDIHYGEWQELNQCVKVIKLNRFSAEPYYEVHREYIDLHFTENGIDEIDLANPNNAEWKDKFNTEMDYQLAEGNCLVSLQNPEGYFVILFPGELHRNRFLKDSTTKLVFKIRKNGKE